MSCFTFDQFSASLLNEIINDPNHAAKYMLLSHLNNNQYDVSTADRSLNQ